MAIVPQLLFKKMVLAAPKNSCIFAGSIIGNQHYARFHRKGEQKVMAENIFSHKSQGKAVTMHLGTFLALSLSAFSLYYQQLITAT